MTIETPTAPTTTETNTAPTETAAPAPTQEPIAASWADQLPDNVKGYVQSKGFKDPASLAESYMNLEKLRGVPAEQILKLPKSREEKEAWGEIYDRLGRPKAPEEYALAPKEADAKFDKEFIEWAQKNFHELGLSTEQGREFMARYNALAEGRGTQAQEEHLATIQAETAALKKEWGTAYDQEVNKAKAAAKELGFSAEDVDGIESVVGYKRTMQFLNKIGQGLQEAEFRDGASMGFTGVPTPAQAQFQIKQLHGDPDFARRYLEGQSDAVQKMNKLHEYAYPEQNA